MSKKTKASKKPVKVEETEDEALLRYWEKHSGTPLTHYLNFNEFKAGWKAAYEYNAE